MINAITSQLINLNGILPNTISTENSTGEDFTKFIDAAGNSTENQNTGLLDTVGSIEENQKTTRANVYRMLSTGEGDSQDALIAMTKAVNQIKDASVLRDKFIDSYHTIMNMQI